MAGAPPIPSGFQLEGRADFDPMGPLFSAGVQATNGYRTPRDILRLRQQGYSPAPDSDHLRGDAVDLVPGKSGWSLQQLEAKAREQFGPQASIGIHDGTHVHVSMKGWGQAPGTPGTKYSGLPDLPAGFKLDQRGKLNGADLSAPQGGGAVQLTGQAHDGDTVRLTDGRNGRLFGYDAFELAQQGRRADGTVEPLGTEARNYLLKRVTPGMDALPTGAQTYGRPVINLSTDPMTDPAHDALRLGLGTAEPKYLKGSPQFGPYMEAERLARLNKLGGFQTNAETPAQFRHGDGPWQSAQPGVYGQPGSEAVFFDDPTPFQGLRADIATGYQQAAAAAKTPDDLLAYAKENGFEIRRSDAEKFIKDRDANHGKFNDTIRYLDPPKPVTNVGDGAFGAGVRGLADPINILDELGAVVDTVAPVKDVDGPRENLWNSDRRFGDIYNNNLDQNRAILDYDEEAHSGARLTGQLASGLLIPGASLEGVGARATEEALANGASEFAAHQAAKRAIATRLGSVGAGEGAVAGAGAGETPRERITGAALGAAGGATLGVVAPTIIDAGVSVARRAVRALRRASDKASADVAEGGLAETAPPMPAGFTVEQPSGARPIAEAPATGAPAKASRSEAMADENAGDNELVGPIVGDPSTANDLPPMPDGFELEAPFGVTREANERLAPEEMAKLAEDVNPASVVPRPASQVDSLEGSVQANPSRFSEVQAPDPLKQLPVRTVTVPSGGKVRVRGPLDLTQSLRLMGGVKDAGGDLAHLGITNAPRKMDFGSNEQFLGNLINNDTGLGLDDAAHALWEEGYFPDLTERPTPHDLIDRLHSESLGTQRYFHPDEWAAVDDFENARIEQSRVEKAQDEGRPLVEDRGTSINLDDLVANTPPVSAYEDTPRLTGKVGNLNLDRLEKPGDVAQLIDHVARRVGGFDAAARGRVTNEETQRLAQEMGVKPEQLLQRRQGQALNAEQLYASRALVQRSRETVVRLAKKSIGGSDEELAAFRKAWLFHAALEEQVSGATAEAGRALQQFKMLASAKDANGEAVRAYLRGGGARDSIEDAARAIVDLAKDPGSANRFIADSVKPTWKDKLVELWYNSLLSGPQTHTVNILSNALTAGLQLPEHAAAAGIGGMRNMIGKARGSAVTDRVLASEIGPRLVGLTQGAQEGLAAFRNTLRTGEVADHMTKVESAHNEAIGGLAGKLIRVPTHLLSAEDEFFKATARRMELAGLAVRKATSEGLTGSALKARIAELNANPTDEMVARSMDYARYLTFQRPLGPAMRHVQAIAQAHPWLKLFIPFVRTPTNILKFAVERSPAAPMLKEVRADIKAGGAARDLAAARIGLGTGLGVLVAEWTASGLITGGGPADDGAKRVMQADGWQPYSVKIGDKYYSYKRLDPLSTTIGVVADAVNLQDHMTDSQRAHVGSLVVSAVMQNLENKVWLSTLSDLNDAIHEPARKGQSFIERLAGSVAVPALVSQTARVIDPVQRETSSESSAQGVLDAIRSRIPFASKKLLPRRDAFGEEVKNEGGLGPDLASPISTSTDKNDLVAKEVLAAGGKIGRVSRDMMGASLPDSMFNEYQAYAGQLTHQYLERQITSPEWQGLNRLQRLRAIAAATTQARSDARLALTPATKGQ